MSNLEIGIGTALVMLGIRPRSRYIIGQDNKKKEQMAPMIPTILSMIMNKKATHSYNQLYTVTSPDIWHQKIGHIGLLGLYKLGKKCLRI